MIGAKLEGVEATIRAMEAKVKQWDFSGVSVKVGYAASYAIYVHEDLEAYHKTGEAKYLERPMRELGLQLFQVVLKAMQGGATPEQALLMAGLRLQRESQMLVPVDTGNLRGSAYTVAEKA